MYRGQTCYTDDIKTCGQKPQIVPKGLVDRYMGDLSIFLEYIQVYIEMFSIVVIFSIFCKPLINFTADTPKTNAF